MLGKITNIIAALVLLIALAFIPGTARATSSNLYLKRITPMVAGQTLTMQVRLNTNGDHINEVQADFTYPTSVLTYVSTDASSSAFEINASTTGGSGTVSIGRGTLTSGGVTGDLLVASVNFTVVANGAVNFTFQNSSAAADATTNNNDLTSMSNGHYATVVPVYRFYIKQTYEHFWTTDANEKNQMISVGYQYEGIAWYSSTDTSKQPVYRLYSAGLRQHLLTIDANEKNVLASSGNWTYEGINEYVNTTANAYPVYRLYAPSLRVHLLTTDANEKNVLASSGSWNYEGIGWYQPD